MQLNDSYTTSFIFSQEQVKAFAEITGDANPIHLDKDYAISTKFKMPIMHGFLSASIFSKIIGMNFPGEGSIYLKQNLQFMKPMFVDIEYLANVSVKNIDAVKKFILLETIISDLENNENTIIGEALVYYPNLNL